MMHLVSLTGGATDTVFLGLVALVCPCHVGYHEHSKGLRSLLRYKAKASRREAAHSRVLQALA